MTESSVAPKNLHPRPAAAWPLIILHFVMGIGAVICGALFFVKPDGSGIGMTTDSLRGSPFNNYVVPGIFLFLFVGVFSVFTAIGLWKQPAWQWPDTINIFKKFHWAWTASLAAGVIDLLWINTEWVMLGYISPLQPAVFIWGVVLVWLTLARGVRQYYRLVQSPAPK